MVVAASAKFSPLSTLSSSTMDDALATYGRIWSLHWLLLPLVLVLGLVISDGVRRLVGTGV